MLCNTSGSRSEFHSGWVKVLDEVRFIWIWLCAWEHRHIKTGSGAKLEAHGWCSIKFCWTQTKKIPQKKIKLNESAVLSFQLPAGIWNLGTRSNRRLCLMSPSLVYLQLIFSPFMWRFKVAKCRGFYKVSNEYRFSVQHHELSSAWLTAVFISAKNSVFCTGSWHFWHSAGWQRSDYMMLF